MTNLHVHPLQADEPLKQRWRGLSHLLLDLDGTLHLGEHLFDDTLPFLASLEAMGIGYTCLTNNSSRSSQDVLARLRRIGLSLQDDQLITSTQIAMDYLARHHPQVRRLFVLGTPGMVGELGQAGFEVSDEEPQAVLVGLDSTLGYGRLCQAAWWISQGLPFLATHPDAVCPTDLPTMLLDCGAICRSLEAATGVSPIWLGKPATHGLPLIQQRTGATPATMAMVGDRLMTDIALASAVDMPGILVLTGDARLEDVARSPWQPDLVVQDVGELAALLAQWRV